MKNIFHALILLSFFALMPVAAQAARVDILPRKIVLDDRQRSADITILNLSDKPSFIRVSMISYRQDEKGLYEELEVPLNPAFDPETAVRLSPRQFSLPAGGRQKIRLAVQKPGDLPDGEYRFHIKTISFDEEDSSVRRSTKNNSMAVKMNVAVVIPVVVRKGQLTSGAKIENISFVPASQASQGMPAMRFDVVRQGQAGVMGTVRILQQQAGSDEPKQLGITSNLNVFSEVAKRTVEVPLLEMPQAGPIRIVYTNDYGDKGVLDEVILQK